jgi:hypothetical protein
VGRPWRNAVRFAASSGVMPRIWRSRETAIGEGLGVVDVVWPGPAVELVGAEPDPSAERAAARTNGEPSRDDRARSGDPCCSWPAMRHLVPRSLPVAATGGVRLGAVGACCDGPPRVAMTRPSHDRWYLRRSGLGPFGPTRPSGR